MVYTLQGEQQGKKDVAEISNFDILIHRGKKKVI